METLTKLNQQRPALCKKRTINRCREVRFYNEQGTRCFWAYKQSGAKVWHIHYGKVVISQQSNGKYILTMSQSQMYNQSANGTIIPKKLESRNQVMELVKNIGTLIIN